MLHIIELNARMNLTFSSQNWFFCKKLCQKEQEKMHFAKSSCIWNSSRPLPLLLFGSRDKFSGWSKGLVIQTPSQKNLGKLFRNLNKIQKAQWYKGGGIHSHLDTAYVIQTDLHLSLCPVQEFLGSPRFQTCLGRLLPKGRKRQLWSETFIKSCSTQAGWLMMSEESQNRTNDKNTMERDTPFTMGGNIYLPCNS